jgi:hypothetical protein
LDGTCNEGEKGEGSCARPAGKKRRAHSPTARRCNLAIVGVASVSLGTGAQGGVMPRADGSELRLRVMTADTTGSPGGKRRRDDRTAQLGAGWSSGGSQRPTRSFGTGWQLRPVLSKRTYYAHARDGQRCPGQPIGTQRVTV